MELESHWGLMGCGVPADVVWHKPQKTFTPKCYHYPLKINVTVKMGVNHKGMKVQTGLRLNQLTWQNYKVLCENSNLRPNEAIELFLNICVEKDSINVVLNSLRSQGPGEKLAYELKLKNLLLDFEYYFRSDEKAGTTEESIGVDSKLNSITELLPLITNQELLTKTENIVNEALTYYRSKMIRK